MKLGLIVEGHGEVQALPLLIRRILQHLAPSVQAQILPPYRVSRGQLVKELELQRAIELMARRVGDGGRLLVLLDSDDDKPCVLGPRLLDWAQKQRADRSISVVVAHREYEAWFIAAAESLQGKRGLPASLQAPPEPEKIRNCKGWLSERMGEGYSETLDQPAFTSVFDLTMARRADSFDKLFRDVGRIFDVAVPPRTP
ncbi:MULTISPECIES: DUF4276 family protein [Myxococcus]|uniref:DUF4276 family protein n=1 Tax=Myxococcus TaxID=32 RepID=UPI0011413BBA|nr:MULTISPECIES: DUF4276 family protein [Myxococcus]MBZ4395239.1 DUF4276 family protein [Myxococcus sp. AS-1-15]MCK8501478.1 DUF4276 family protein [Myxococcus fulvus]BDT30592.1 DUF4276 family protein [Myxococcus sp. MH1]